MTFSNGSMGPRPSYQGERPDVLVLDEYSGEFYSAELRRLVDANAYYVLEDTRKGERGDPLYRVYGPFHLRIHARHLRDRVPSAQIIMGYELAQRAPHLEAVQLMGTDNRR